MRGPASGAAATAAVVAAAAWALPGGRAASPAFAESFDQLASCMHPMQACVSANGLLFAGTAAACTAAGGTWHQAYADADEFELAAAAELAALRNSGAKGMFLIKLPPNTLLSDYVAKLPGTALMAPMLCNGEYFVPAEATAQEFEAYSATFGFAQPPALKVDPFIATVEAAKAADEPVTRRIYLAPSAQANTTEAVASWKLAHAQRRRLRADLDVELEFKIGTPLSGGAARGLGIQQKYVLVTAPASAARGDSSPLADLAAQPGIAYLEHVLPVMPVNIDAAYITQSGSMRLPIPGGNSQTLNPELATIWQRGLTGLGQVIAVADSGLDMESCAFSDAEVNEAANKAARMAQNSRIFKYNNHRKLVHYITYADGDEGEEAGHGTHVVGSIAGQSGDEDFKGMAFEAKVAFADIGLPGVNSLDLPPDLDDIFDPAFEDGARLHSNSWGSTANVYNSFAFQMDGFMYNNQEMLFLVAAGNSGEAGKIGTLGAPATAKSVLSVGASMNSDHFFSSRGKRCADFNPGSFDGLCPLNLADFSSAGPTTDGRIKPEVVAPGKFVDSASSQESGESCTQTPKAGTSMATPVVSGNAALIRQYFEDGFFPTGVATAENGFSPMGALVKAMLINGAQQQIGSYNNVDLSQDSRPSVLQGFGRIQLDQSLRFADSSFNLFVHDGMQKASQFTSVGSSRQRTFKINTGHPFRVTLAWSDFPANSANGALVNDLDLIVIGPNNEEFFPNGRNSRDSVNVVEHVELVPGQFQAGNYTVRVTASSLAQVQPFALVVTGDFEDEVAPTVPPTPEPTPQPVDDSPVTVPTPAPVNVSPVSVPTSPPVVTPVVSPPSSSGSESSSGNLALPVSLVAGGVLLIGAAVAMVMNMNRRPPPPPPGMPPAYAQATPISPYAGNYKGEQNF